MLQPALSFSISIFFLMFSVLSKSTTNSNIYVQCSQLYFDSMTPYESNVNSLFTSLVDSSSIYNFNKFQISLPEYSQNDVVYGLFQCRGDLSSSNCKECVTSSISQLKTNCPVSTSGAIQLDGCLVKYDNSSFFGAGDKMEVLKRCGPSVGYNSDVLNHVDAALANLIAGNGQYFRSCEDGSIQGMAQCVQDLSVSDCQDCLSEVCGLLRSECETSTWGDMYLGKCYMRYFDQVIVRHAHEGTSSSNKSSSGGSGSDIKEWIAIILSAMAATGTVAYAVTNSNSNINVNNNTVKNLENDVKNFKIEVTEKVAAADGKAAAADKKAEKVRRIAEEKADDKKYGMPPYPVHAIMPQYPIPNPNIGMSPYPYGMPPCPMRNPNPEPTCTIQ